MAIAGKKRYSGLSVLNYNEIQNPRKRKGIIDFDRLMDLLGFENYEDLKGSLYKWVFILEYVVTHPQPSHNPVNLDFLFDPLSKSEFLSLSFCG